MDATQGLEEQAWSLDCMRLDLFTGGDFMAIPWFNDTIPFSDIGTLHLLVLAASSFTVWTLYNVSDNYLHRASVWPPHPSNILQRMLICLGFHSLMFGLDEQERSSGVGWSWWASAQLICIELGCMACLALLRQSFILAKTLTWLAEPIWAPIVTATLTSTETFGHLVGDWVVGVWHKHDDSITIVFRNIVDALEGGVTGGGKQLHKFLRALYVRT